MTKESTVKRIMDAFYKDDSITSLVITFIDVDGYPSTITLTDEEN